MGRTSWFVAASSIALLSACGGKKDPNKDDKGSDVGKPVAPPTHLEPDGKLTYGVSSVYMGMPTDPDAGGTATVSAMPAKGTKVDIDLAFTAKTGREQKLSVKGSLSAEGCGEQDAATGPG